MRVPFVATSVSVQWPLLWPPGYVVWRCLIPSAHADIANVVNRRVHRDSDLLAAASALAPLFPQGTWAGCRPELHPGREV